MQFTKLKNGDLVLTMKEIIDTRLKEIILSLLALVLTWASLWYWHKIIPYLAATAANSHSPSYYFLSLALLLLMGGGMIFLLSSIFVKSRLLRWVLVITATTIPLLIFEKPDSKTIIGIVSLLVMLTAMHRIKREFDLALGFSLSKIAKAGLPLYFTAVSILVSFFYLHQIEMVSPGASAFLPKPAFELTFKSMSRPIQSLTGLNSIGPQSTVNDLLKDVVARELGTRGIATSQISDAELKRLLDSQRQALAQQYKISLNGQEKISDVFYTTVTEKIADILGPYSRYLPWLSALTFFLAFKALTIPLYYLSLVLTFLLIKIMLFVKILRSETIQLNVQKLVL